MTGIRRLARCLTWSVIAALIAPACQVIDDARYKPRIGPLVPDAMIPPDALRTGSCVVTPGDTCGDSDLMNDVSFSRDIQPLINRATPGGCMTHTMMPTMATVRLDMSSYATLRKGGVISGERIIIDCRPCDSLLVNKLAEPMPRFGQRMPMDMHYWSDVEMTLLRDWIAEGARDN
jgi:hypothetical protein